VVSVEAHQLFEYPPRRDECDSDKFIYTRDGRIDLIPHSVLLFKVFLLLALWGRLKSFEITVNGTGTNGISIERV
jgi:hypothetical protein